MSKIYKQNCKQCGEYYERQGKYFCSLKCRGLYGIDEYIKQKMGLKNMGRIPWNKGLKGYLAGEKNPGYIDGGTLLLCPICNNEFRVATSTKNSRKFCSFKCKGDWMSENLIGKNSPSYLHGQSKESYPKQFSKKLKEKIKQRDNYICQYCNIADQDCRDRDLLSRGLTVHHIDYNKNNCQDTNLITLCLSCNVKANYNRDYWIDYYKNILCVAV